MTILFDRCARSEYGPARYTELHIDYLDRSARTQIELVREQMQAWLDMVPHPHRRELAVRLRNRDDHHFEAAFFELYLQALLRGLGYAVRFHPRAGRGKRPDFLIRSISGASLLFEAATVDEMSAAARAAKNRLVAIYDALNQIDCPDYF